MGYYYAVVFFLCLRNKTPLPVKAITSYSLYTSQLIYQKPELSNLLLLSLHMWHNQIRSCFADW